MKNYKTLIIIYSLILIGCNRGNSRDDTNTTDDINITSTTIIVDDTPIKSLGSASNIEANISIGDTPKSIYIVLSNSATSSYSPTITHNGKIVSYPNIEVAKSKIVTKADKILPKPDYITNFKPKELSTIPKSKSKIVYSKRSKDVEGSSQIFSLDENGRDTILATARKTISNITTNMGSRGVNIWVSDNSFDSGSGCSKAKCITQDMVNVLADIFLKDGLDNDIFDWVTNIYGSEWDSNATVKNSSLIGADGDITILMTDIDRDNSIDGGVIGYSWSKDNYFKSRVSGSNERIMFYVDSVMFANNEDKVWTIDSFWAKEMVSTLAHELQHVISFYQKETMQGLTVDTWLGEMLSETVEDLVATKVRYTGPRGVVYTDGSDGDSDNIVGRYPLFNANSRLSLTNWSYSLADYSKVSAFGTYLIRNYGGAKLLKDMMDSSFGDYRAVEEAVQKTPNGTDKTFANLLHEWGIAIILSDSTNLVDLPTYNTGDFSPTTYNNITYHMGSINFFNYSPQPHIYTTIGTIISNSNYFYKVGDNLTEDITIRLKLNGKTEATLVFK